MRIDIESVNQILSGVIDPNTQTDFVSARTIKNIKIEGRNISLAIELGYPAKSQVEIIQNLISSALKAIPGIEHINIDVYSKIVAHTTQPGMKPLPNVKNIIAIASGKGGVGKSTTATNIALALASEGATVGILDADIYGASQPLIMGIEERAHSLDGKTTEPIEKYGIQISSIGFLLNSDEPVIWRGPMVTQALLQLVEHTNWRDLDYLIVDMPPGTGDIQLTLSKKIPVTGAVIVTTPQDIALRDAIKGLKMFEKVGVAILGVIENMSSHICSQCGHIEHIFGQEGGKQMSEHYKVDLLGELPLVLSVREHTDSGVPLVMAEPDSAMAQLYKNIARRIAVKVAEKPIDRSGKLPPVVVRQV